MSLLPPAGRGEGAQPRQDRRVCSVPARRRSHPRKPLPSGGVTAETIPRGWRPLSAPLSCPHLHCEPGCEGQCGEERVPRCVPLGREGAEHPAPSPRRAGTALPTEGPGRGGQRHLRGDPGKAGGGAETCGRGLPARLPSPAARGPRRRRMLGRRCPERSRPGAGSLLPPCRGAGARLLPARPAPGPLPRGPAQEQLPHEARGLLVGGRESRGGSAHLRPAAGGARGAERGCSGSAAAGLGPPSAPPPLPPSHTPLPPPSIHPSCRHLARPAHTRVRTAARTPAPSHHAAGHRPGMDPGGGCSAPLRC